MTVGGDGMDKGDGGDFDTDGQDGQDFGLGAGGVDSGLRRNDGRGLGMTVGFGGCGFRLAPE